MDPEKALVVFQGTKIRKVWHNSEWFFAIADVVEALTNTPNASDYLKKIRKRDSELNKGWGQIVTPLKIETSGGTQTINCTNTKGAFRLIQSIPSPKAEPFKLWLAQVGYERVEEIQNPELAQERMKQIYEQKGYSKEWIEKRLRGIAIRQELTDEWKQRGVGEGKEFAILTNEISFATFGKTIEEYKKFKSLGKQNLRDHMNDLELIFNMLGEKVTTEITRAKSLEQLDGCKKAAIEGGEVAGNARKEAEQKIGKTIVSNENYLSAPEKEKRKQLSKP